MSVSRHPGLNLHHADPATHDRAETVIFGFWVFLMADLIIFSLLLATYGSMAVHGVADGPGPADLFDLKMPLLETTALLLSSFTIGMAILEVKYATRPRAMVLWLLATAALGLVFLGLELRDYYVLIAEKDAPPQRSGFLSIYYLLTGTHWVHVASGLLWMSVLLTQLAVFGLNWAVKLRLMRLALYWHMLDVVWVGIFTFVFLFGVAQ